MFFFRWCSKSTSFFDFLPIKSFRRKWLNIVQLIGYLKDPELCFLSNENAYATLRLANKNELTNALVIERETRWHTIKFWGKEVNGIQILFMEGTSAP